MRYQLRTVLRFGFLFLTLFALPTLACSFNVEEDEVIETPEVFAKPVSRSVIVDFDGAPVRNGPGVDYDQIGNISEGKQLEVIAVSSDGNWYQVTPPETIKNMNPDWEVWISVLYTAELVPPGFPMAGTQTAP
jgi:uncharacterized protein YgiM (DUF1202 family)